MTRIHAFGDDALGDLDAVGLVEALDAGKVSAAELVEAAIARTEAVNPTLNGLAYEAFDRARARAGARTSVRRLLRRGAVVHQGQRRRRRHADDGGHRRVEPAAQARRRRLRARLPGDRPYAAGQNADVRVRFQRVGGASAARRRCATRGTPITPPVRRRRARGVRRRGCGADRARQRRRRFDPNPCRLQRISGAQAVARPAAA